MQRTGHGDVHGGREDVVRGLRRVDVVVGVHGRAEVLGGERGKHLVDVHVARGAAAGLVDVDRELVVVVAGDDGVGRLHDRVGDLVWSSTPSEALATAADFLMRASATICAGSRPDPEIGKFSTARWVCAPYSASMGTRTSPIVSCSIRYSGVLAHCRVASFVDSRGLLSCGGRDLMRCAGRARLEGSDHRVSANDALQRGCSSLRR